MELKNNNVYARKGEGIGKKHTFFGKRVASHVYNPTKIYKYKSHWLQVICIWLTRLYLVIKLKKTTK